MPTPQFFFAQPQFRASVSDRSLALASHYYCFEVFATAEDRDACCGPTAHPNVKYVRATTEDIVQNDMTIDDVGCGVPHDHPHFELIMAPLFDAAIARLFRSMPRAPKRSGPLGSVELFIARTRYTVFAEAKKDWVTFPIEAMTVFEEADQSVTDRTLEWLQGRLAISTSSSLLNARPS
ncbi:hypothetical protein GGD65_007836 [Bradyrhizobium sp. CIR18]|uniref:hypothetical protein n=1 Tax=Bradyrhizobium sp. CIR18 TaxID=2663839 RepID=UPI0016060074|nr:hypothetical protein [Bradyrhizobium sp. CIR18]MBB4366762.1 hypothetical protein [Bradyrhizobium sp. CIR18]